MTENLPALADAYLRYAKARGMARSTLGVYGAILWEMLGRLEAQGARGLEDLTALFLEHYFYTESLRAPQRGPRACKQEGAVLSRRVLHHERTVLQSFFKYLTETGVTLRNEAHGLDLGKAPRAFRTPPSRAAVRRLLSATGQGPIGLRDRAIFEVFYSTGIRRAELCGLDVYSLDRAAGVLRILEGKGGKDRVVPVGRIALLALDAYLVHGRPKLRPQGEALFVGEWGRRLKPASINYIFRQWSRRLALQPPITPHLLRHACATHMLENGADIRHVQVLLGHARVSTTEVYTHVSAQHLREELARHNPRALLEKGHSI